MDILLTLALFATTCLLLIAGFPVAFTLAGTALLFSLAGSLAGMDTLIGNLPGRIFGNAMSNETLMAVPFFIFMGVMLEKSRIAETLLTATGRMMGNRRGGISIAVILVGALLAASTGIVGATVVAMGVISLPTMLRHGYPAPVACGTICAAGTLGQIIPPSIVLVILGDQITSAYQTAQSQLQQQAWSTGQMDFTPRTVSIGDLFAGALLPGLVLVGLYCLYLLLYWLGRPISTEPVGIAADRTAPSLAAAILPPVLLIVAVLGSILGGVASPTEAAALGAVGATLLAARALPAAIIPEKPEPVAVTHTAAGLCGMVLGGILGAVVFLDTDLFLLAPLGTAGIGLASAVILVRTGWLSRLFQALSGARIDLTRWGFYAAIALFLLSVSVDLRFGRDAISGIETAAIALATVLSIGILLAILTAFYRVWRAGILVQVNRATLEVTSMIFAILIGAALFSLVFRDFGGDDLVHRLLSDLPGGSFAALLVVMLTLFVLGFFLDFVEICFVVVPIVAPVLLLDATISPVWLGVMMALVLQTSFLTPPFGFALFYLRGVAPDSVQTLDIYRGVAPFIALQVLAVAILWAFPMLAEWLPGMIFK